MAREGEGALACAVIDRAIRDFINSKGGDTGAYNFITGKTEIGRFWFYVANIRPLRVGRGELYELLTGNSDLIEYLQQKGD